MGEPSITVSELELLLRSGGVATLVDVRKQPAYEEDPLLIPGARKRDHEQVSSWACDVPENGRVVVYCVHGHEVSQGAAGELRALGRDASYLEGGIEAWREAGNDVAPGSADHGE